MEEAKNTREEIDADLPLPKQIPPFPISIRWESDHPELLDDSGRLNAAGMPPEGAAVTLFASLRYFDRTRIISFPLHIVSPAFTDKNTARRLEEKLRLSLSDQPEDSQISLPDTIGGKTIRWQRPRSLKGLYLLLLSLLGITLYPWMERNRKRQATRHKKELLLRDYATVTDRLTLYLDCGLSVRNALEKTAVLPASDTPGVHPVYAELTGAVNELKSGRSLTEALLGLQDRIDLPQYRQLCTLLLQHTKKGTKGLCIALHKEVRSALQEKKNLARKKGEEAGAKLLIPILLMFTVVLVIMMTPALLSLHT